MVILALITKKTITLTEIEGLRTIVFRFLRLYYRLYGENQANTKLHTLVHLPALLEEYGPLSNYSSFVYESMIRRCKRFVANDNAKDMPANILRRFWMNQVLAMVLMRFGNIPVSSGFFQN